MSLKVVLPACLLLAPSVLRATEVEGELENSLVLETFEYRQRVYSASEATGLGEKARWDAAVHRYFSPQTYLRFRLEIDPDTSPEENKSSKFELRLHHAADGWEYQADLDVYGDDYGRGATTIGLDSDSKDSYVAYQNGSFRGTFYPYNFGGEVGREFRTWDITRIYYVEGTPSFLSNLPVEAEKIRMKTLPGFVLEWHPHASLMTYLGVGAASYLYPASPDFSFEQNASAERWQVEEDQGYKAGATWKNDGTRLTFEGVRHLNSSRTGSLMEGAWSLQVGQELANWEFQWERTQSHAGSAPFRLNREGRWFQDTTPFLPIYADYYGQRQDWIGKVDAANMVKASYQLSGIKPYVALKYLGAHFLFRERESAQRLRTADDTQSHGGLGKFAVGAQFSSGKFTIRPELELMQAQNAVFGNKSDIREDKILRNLSKRDSVISLSLSYLNE